MKAEHDSRKEATETLMNYICNHKPINGYHPSPFDFTLKEVDVKDVNEVITGFESARKALGLKPNTGYEISERIPKFISVAQLVNDINPKHIKALIALNELFTIAEAWNMEDEFVPDFSDWNQDKWFPWFKYDKDVAKFVCADTINAATAASAHLGSRLCFKTSERAEQFGKQFDDLYNEVFL
jgi:hypothetical protein